MDVLGYKSVHLLCTVNGSLKATHFATVMQGGPKPVWGLFTIREKFVRFYGSRAEIERAYPDHVWRRKMGSWNLHDLEDKTVPRRREELIKKYGGSWPHATAG